MIRAIAISIAMVAALASPGAAASGPDVFFQLDGDDFRASHLVQFDGKTWTVAMAGESDEIAQHVVMRVAFGKRPEWYPAPSISTKTSAQPVDPPRDDTAVRAKVAGDDLPEHERPRRRGPDKPERPPTDQRPGRRRPEHIDDAEIAKRVEELTKLGGVESLRNEMRRRALAIQSTKLPGEAMKHLLAIHITAKRLGMTPDEVNLKIAEIAAGVKDPEVKRTVSAWLQRSRRRGPRGVGGRRGMDRGFRRGDR